jgi:DNA-binding LytR/AlgR family response regulator
MPGKSGDDRALGGLKVLVVEDQFLVAEDIRRSVVALGGDVLGPFPNLSKARAALQDAVVDFAVLDVHLNNEEVFPLADELSARNVPFVFATGYDGWVLPAKHRDRPRVEKPVSVQSLRDLVAALRSGGG